MHVDRWAYLIVVFAALALAVCPMLGCGDDDDDETDDDVVDDDIADDDIADDDVADDDIVDDDVADDDTAPEDYLQVDPWAQIVPAGTTYAYTAEGIIDGTPVDSGFTWTTDDGGVATIDQSGVVTAVADGDTFVHAAAGDLIGDALVMVGPDAFVFDNLSGLLMAIDRGSETAVADLLVGKGSIGAVLNDVKVNTEAGFIYLVDSSFPTPGDEKLILVDVLDDFAVTNIALAEGSNPWAATYFAGDYWVTGNLDDTLAQVTVDGDKADVVYHDLDAGCVPTDVTGIGNYLYVACSGFDIGTMSYEPGKLLVINPSTGDEVKQIDLPQVNPTHFATVPCEDDIDLFVACRGDYAAETGKIAKICTMENVVKSSFDLGLAPGPIGINSDGIGFVGEGFAGSVYVFDSANNSVIHGEGDPIVIPGAFWIQGLGVHPETGNAYVCDQGSGKVYVLSGDDYNEVFNVDLTNPGGVAFW